VHNVASILFCTVHIINNHATDFASMKEPNFSFRCFAMLHLLLASGAELQYRTVILSIGTVLNPRSGNRSSS